MKKTQRIKDLCVFLCFIIEYTVLGQPRLILNHSMALYEAQNADADRVKLLCFLDIQGTYLEKQIVLILQQELISYGRKSLYIIAR